MISGAVATGSSQAAVMLIQLSSAVVMSRLLSPADFGLLAMAWPVIGFLSLFQDFGLGQAAVQRRTLAHEDVNFLFWLNIAAGLLVGAIVIAAAPLAALFYGKPEITPLFVAMSGVVLVQALGAPHTAILTRRMRFRCLAMARLVGAAGGFATAVAWALVAPSYWALLAGSLASVLLPACIAWVYSGWRPGRPRLSQNSASLFGFGAGLTGFNLSNFFARNADNVLIGRFLGEVQLGFYDRAYKLLLLPLRQTANPLAGVMIPALSRMLDEPERYRRAYLSVLPIMLIGILPGVVALIAVADTFVPFLLGEKWQPSAAIFSALGFAGMLQPLNNPAGWLFVSQGRTREFMIWGIVTAVTSVGAFLIGIPYGVVGVALVYSASEYLRTPLLWWYVGRSGPVSAKDMLVTAGPIILGAHVSLAGLWALQPHIDLNPFARAMTTAALSYAIVCGLVLLFPSGRVALASGLQVIAGALPRGRKLSST